MKKLHDSYEVRSRSNPSYSWNTREESLDVKTETQRVDDSTVRLKVVVEPDEFEPEIEKAARDLASRIKLKGFRKGRVPRQVLEAHLGRGAITEAAVNSSLGRYLEEAARVEDLEVVAEPKIESVDVSTGGLCFEVTLRVMPEIDTPKWEGLEIEIPSLSVSDEEVDREIDAFRERVAPLEPVARPAKENDFVLIDITGQIHGKPVPGLSLKDFSYQLGSGSIVPKLDKELESKRPGDILKFNDTIRVRQATTSDEARAATQSREEADEGQPQEATFTVIVKEVRERRPQPLTDAWVEDNTEFDTVDQLRSDVRKKLELAKKIAARSAARHLVASKLAEAIETDIPEEAIEEEVADIARRFSERLQQAGLSLGQYARSIEKSRGEIEYEWRKQAIFNLKSDLCLRRIAKEEGIVATEEDLEREASAIAAMAGDRADKVKEELTKGRPARSLAAGIIRSKALERVLEKAVLIPEGGEAITWRDLYIAEPEKAEGPPEESSTNSAKAGEIRAKVSTQSERQEK